MNKQEFIEQFINANNNEERVEITKEAFEALECEFYDFDDLLEYVEETLAMITSHSNEELNYFARLVFENLTSIAQEPELVDVVLLLPNLSAFKATIPNSSDYKRDFVCSQNYNNAYNGFDASDFFLEQPFINKYFALWYHSDNKFSGGPANRIISMPQYSKDVVFSPVIISNNNWMGGNMSLLEEDIAALIIEFNRPERMASGQENQYDYQQTHVFVER